MRVMEFDTASYNRRMPTTLLTHIVIQTRVKLRR